MSAVKLARMSRDRQQETALCDATLLLRLVAEGEADLQEGRVLSQDEAFARVRSRLKNG